MLPDDAPAVMPGNPDPAPVAVHAPLQFGFLPGVLDYQATRYYVGNPPHRQLRERIRRGEFPPGLKLGPNWLVWLKDDLDAYLEARLADPASIEPIPRRRRRHHDAEAA